MIYQVGTLERSDKIRTYNYQQDRISDHLIGLTMYGVESFLAGTQAPDDMIEQLRDFDRKEKLLELFESTDAHHQVTKDDAKGKKRQKS